MRNFFAAYLDLAAAIGAAFRTPRVLALLTVVALITLAGAAVFSVLEGWSFTNAVYFAVVSMATVGYGDLAPKTPAGRLFTIGFLMVSVGVFVMAVTTLAEAVMRNLRAKDAQRAPQQGPKQRE
jgi:voltage-gated potassium channel